MTNWKLSPEFQFPNLKAGVPKRKIHPSCPKTPQDLEKAIRNLTIFAEQNKRQITPELHRLEVEDGSIIPPRATSRIWNGVQIACALFSERTRQELELKKKKIEGKIRESLSVILKYYPLLAKLEEGTEIQKKLAKSARQSIENFNGIVASTKKSPQSFAEKLKRFVFQRMGLFPDHSLLANPINLPELAVLHFSEAKILQEARNSSQKIAFLAESLKCVQASPVDPTSWEKDAFRMKAITLIQKKLGKNFSYQISEALQSIRETPIFSKAAAEEGVVSFSQKITPFPGEEIEVIGSFHRKYTVSLPVPDSFSLSSKSVQTGFPYPSQHCGWALSSHLIPSCPVRQDLLPTICPLLQKQKEIAHALLPGGELIQKAKELLALKKKAFHKKTASFLGLHKTLCLSILHASGYAIGEGFSQILDVFFTHVEEQTSPYDYLCQVQLILIETCLNKPAEKLKDAWLTTPMGVSGAQALLEKERKEARRGLNLGTALDDYVALMGEVLGKASEAILMQELSEQIHFAPPLLTDFERKVQSALYKQLITFQNEFSLKLEEEDREHNLEIMTKWLEKSIKSDISLFKQPSFEQFQHLAADCVAECEAYYNERYLLEKSHLEEVS